MSLFPFVCHCHSTADCTLGNRGSSPPRYCKKSAEKFDVSESLESAKLDQLTKPWQVPHIGMGVFKSHAESPQNSR